MARTQRAAATIRTNVKGRRITAPLVRETRNLRRLGSPAHPPNGGGRNLWGSRRIRGFSGTDITPQHGVQTAHRRGRLSHAETRQAVRLHLLGGLVVNESDLLR